MNGFAHAARAKLDDRACLVDGINKGNCGVSLVDVPDPHVVIDLDEAGSPLGKTRAKCDFLFFADPNLVAPIRNQGRSAEHRQSHQTAPGRRQRR